LFLSSIFAYYKMLPEQLKEFGESLISIIFVSSNIYFWWKDDGYFSQLSELNPLVHTWSLAVEEQFYFLFPLLCYLFLTKRKDYFIIGLIFFGVISLFLCQWGGNLWSISIDQFQMFSQHRYASFYLPIGRIWELLLGALAAFYLQMNSSTKYIFNIEINCLILYLLGNSVTNPSNCFHSLVWH
jgi:peptidoglycan/LPS O-acetylase OafA/YrhL